MHFQNNDVESVQICRNITSVQHQSLPLRVKLRNHGGLSDDDEVAQELRWARQWLSESLETTRAWRPQQSSSLEAAPCWAAAAGNLKGCLWQQLLRHPGPAVVAKQPRGHAGPGRGCWSTKSLC